MIRKKETKISFDSMLGETVISSSDLKKKKDQLNVIELNKELSKELDKYVEAKTMMKTSEGEMRLAEQPILEACLERMDKDAFENNFNSSYELKTVNGKCIKFVTTDRFNLSQDEENVQVLKDLLGENFEKEVVKKPTVTLKADVFTDEKLKKELVSIMGDKFSKFFETTIKFSLKSGFDERMYNIAKNKNEIIQIRSICGKNKPFLK
jgi:hypothetical protein